MKRSKSLTARVRALYEANPSITSKAIAAKLNVTLKQAYATLYLVRKAADMAAKDSSPPPSGTLVKTEVAPVVDFVNHPPHYKDGGIETIDYIEAKGLNYHLGNVVKYVSRAGKKGQLMSPKQRAQSAIVDLEKAKWYLDREIKVTKSFRDSLGL